MKKNYWHLLQKNYNTILSILLLVFFSVIGMLYYLDRYHQLKEVAAQEALWRPIQDFEKERYELALKGDGVSSGFFYIIKNYPKTKAANMASYYIALTYLKLEKIDHSITFLEKTTFSKSNICASMRLGLLAIAYYKSKKKKKAASYYRQAIELDTNSYVTPIYLLRLAHLLEEEGDLKAARKCYSRVIDLKPLEAIAQEAEMHQERLSVLIKTYKKKPYPKSAT